MPRMLVVDDDDEILALLTEYFRQHGYQVMTAKDGLSMFGLLKEQAFDVVVLDVMLPREDGLSLCGRLRAASQIPVIMLTAMGDDTDRIVGLEIGADDYLVKPFNARELLVRVKSLLRRSSMASSAAERADAHPTMVFAGWRLDLASDVQVTIIDHGPGIPTDALEAVFAPFQRLEPSRNRQTGGMGLGLTAARAGFRAHGGDVALSNEPTGGLRASHPAKSSTMTTV